MDVIIREFGDFDEPGAFLLDMQKTEVKDCLGCWNCWLKTPGRCAHTDLDDFYTAFVNADEVVFFTAVSRGFVSGNMKTLFDRLIPHYLPYIGYDTGESRHFPRYEKYPRVVVYYQDDFSSEQERDIYVAYLRRVFYQFYMDCDVHPVSKYMREAV